MLICRGKNQFLYNVGELSNLELAQFMVHLVLGLWNNWADGGIVVCSRLTFHARLFGVAIQMGFAIGPIFIWITSVLVFNTVSFIISHFV